MSFDSTAYTIRFRGTTAETGTYEATLSDGVVTIVCGSRTFTFDSTDNAMTDTSDDTIYAMLSSDTVIIELTDAETLSDVFKGQYCGTYHFASGESFNPILADLMVKLIISNDGEAVTVAGSYEITDVTMPAAHLEKGFVYGTFDGGYYIFNEDGTVFYNQSGACLTGEYVISDITTATVSVDVTRHVSATETVTFNGYTKTDLFIADASYDGAYPLNLMFDGAPFLGTFTSSESYTFYIDVRGTAMASMGDLSRSGNLLIKSISGDVYTFDFYSPYDLTNETVVIDMSARTLTYLSVTFEAPAYMG